jgi:hypothetical protein
VTRCYIMGVVPDGGISRQWFEKWVEIVIDAMSCYNKESGHWIHLPNAGGLYDQDRYIMDIWDEVKYRYISNMKDPDVIHFLQTETEKQSKAITDKLAAKRKR